MQVALDITTIVADSNSSDESNNIWTTTWAALTVVNLGTTSSETVQLKCMQIKKTPTNRGLQVLLLWEPHVIGLSIADCYPSQKFWIIPCIRDSKASLSFFSENVSQSNNYHKYYKLCKWLPVEYL